VTFDLLPVRFDFTALSRIHFAPGQAGNLLRGSFGLALRRVASHRDYIRIFEPKSKGPSGLADPPRPFVFRASHLNGATIQPGELFSFLVHLFDTRNPPVQLFADAFAAMTSEKLPATLTGSAPADLLSLPLEPVGPFNRITLEFTTPTELKNADRPEFDVLLARIRDRISTLRALYGPGPLEIDFRAVGERAKKIRMTRCDLQRVAATRRSARTGQTHTIGGFTGTAEYEGDLTEFVPYLEAARYTGVGRHCVWGNGEIAIQQTPGHAEAPGIV